MLEFSLRHWLHVFDQIKMTLTAHGPVKFKVIN